MSRYCVYFDLESTGLSRWHDKIVQIGATITLHKDDKTDEKLGEFETLVKCDKKIHAKAAEVTGIYDHHLLDAPLPAHAFTQFFEWLSRMTKEHPGIPVCLLAYNGFNFDFPMFMSELCRWDFDILTVFKSHRIDMFVDPLVWARDIDTKCLLRKSSGKCSFVLQDVHMALVGTPIENAHQALADTEALMKVCRHAEFHGMLAEKESPKNACIIYLKDALYLNAFLEKRSQMNLQQKTSSKKRKRSIFDMTSKKKTKNL
jgi:DNA polymerase III alpha subunit (gram-positive type)